MTSTPFFYIPRPGLPEPSLTARDVQRIATLHPRLQPLARRLILEGGAALHHYPEPSKLRAVRYGITQAYRSYAEQAALYGQGRTESQLTSIGVPGHFAKPNLPRVSNARPGRSLHERMLDGRPAAQAFDVAPFDASGQPIWDTRAPEWQLIGAVGRSLGLTWGGDFTSIKDMPHFELHL